eukprot:CAMPEP_0114543464 /NCGR_PEP_ID=MMETSP0114-20121206/2370_1 /TAXON_ID=31324 /ORGANISM="Goniomonas sp, Strain m" /LENGTH=678 /DNA_ID=CAMNT_0001727805 /DNA_START=46 /DNA_END=2082 /DNA_ORIENTATION=+
MSSADLLAKYPQMIIAEKALSASRVLEVSNLEGTLRKMLKIIDRNSNELKAASAKIVSLEAQLKAHDEQLLLSEEARQFGIETRKKLTSQIKRIDGVATDFQLIKNEQTDIKDKQDKAAKDLAEALSRCPLPGQLVQIEAHIKTNTEHIKRMEIENEKLKLLGQKAEAMEKKLGFFREEAKKNAGDIHACQAQVNELDEFTKELDQRVSVNFTDHVEQIQAINEHLVVTDESIVTLRTDVETEIKARVAELRASDATLTRQVNNHSGQLKILHDNLKKEVLTINQNSKRTEERFSTQMVQLRNRIIQDVMAIGPGKTMTAIEALSKVVDSHSKQISELFEVKADTELVVEGMLSKADALQLWQLDQHMKDVMQEIREEEIKGAVERIQTLVLDRATIAEVKRVESLIRKTACMSCGIDLTSSQPRNAITSTAGGFVKRASQLHRQSTSQDLNPYDLAVPGPAPMFGNDPPRERSRPGSSDGNRPASAGGGKSKHRRRSVHAEDGYNSGGGGGGGGGSGSSMGGSRERDRGYDREPSSQNLNGRTDDVPAGIQRAEGNPALAPPAPGFGGSGGKFMNRGGTPASRYRAKEIMKQTSDDKLGRSTPEPLPAMTYIDDRDPKDIPSHYPLTSHFGGPLTTAVNALSRSQESGLRPGRPKTGYLPDNELPSMFAVQSAVIHM